MPRTHCSADVVHGKKVEIASSAAAAETYLFAETKIFDARERDAYLASAHVIRDPCTGVNKIVKHDPGRIMHNSPARAGTKLT